MRAVYILFILLTGLFSAAFFPGKKKFPAFSYTTMEGRTITNEDIKGKRTLVITGYLGCGVAMRLMKDIEDLPDSSRSKIIVVLGNTPGQLKEFNSVDKNKWSSIRNYFHLEPFHGNIVAECKTENFIIENGDTIIGEQCRELTAKINTWSSPTLVYVDEKGYIYKKRKGYFGDEDKAERTRKMLEPLMSK